MDVQQGTLLVLATQFKLGTTKPQYIIVCVMRAIQLTIIELAAEA